MSLYHPLCHLVRGERLYYLLIETTMNLSEVKTFINKYMKQNSALGDSCCVYFTFGDNDLILRVWANDDSFYGLHMYLEKQKDIDNIDVFIIDSMYSWYQKEIEDRHMKSVINSLLIPDDIISYRSPSDLMFDDFQDKGIRYFMFLDEPYGGETTLFLDLFNIIKLNKNDKNKKAYFDGIDHISLYSYQAKTYRGVILKGQTKSLDKIAESSRNITTKFKLTTTTYISFERFSQSLEGDELNNTEMAPLTHQMPETVDNLLKSHDCYKRKIKNLPDAERRRSAFCKKIAELGNLLFYYDMSWWQIIEEIRKIYKWIVFKKNDTLLDYLRGTLVEYEVFFRTNLERYLPLLRTDETDKEVISSILKKHVTSSDISIPYESIKKYYENRNVNIYGESEKHFAFSSAPKILQKLLIVKKASPEIKQGINEIIQCIGKCLTHRNLIMHGQIMDLFKTRKNNWIWEEYVFDIIKMMLLLHRYEKEFNLLVGNPIENETFVEESKKLNNTLPRKIKPKYKIALSFAGEKREYIQKVAHYLNEEYSKKKVFYDHNFMATLARAKIKSRLKEIFQDKTELIVVFICSNYISKNYCKIEWKIIYNLLKSDKTSNVMFFQFEDAKLPNLNDYGRIAIENQNPQEIANLIIKRYRDD